MTTKSVRVESGVAGAAERHHLNRTLQGCDGLYVMQRLEDPFVEQAEAAHAAQHPVGVRGAWPVVGHQRGARAELDAGARRPEQQACPQYVKAVPLPCSVDCLGNPVQRLRVGVRDGGVQHGQNLRTPVRHGRQQLPEVGLEVRRHRGGEAVEGLDGLVPGQVEQVIERLLQPVGFSELGLVVQPHVPVEALLLRQAGSPHVEGGLGAQPVAAHGGLLALLQADAHRLHAAAGHADDVELVHDDRHTGQELVAHVQVRPPHVDGDALDHATVLEAVEPARQGQAVAVGQQLDGLAGAEVGDDQAQLPVDGGFVDAHPLREGRQVAAVHMGDVLAGQGADGLLVAPDMVSDADEGLQQALLLDVLGAALGHPAVLANAGQGLPEGLTAVTALVPAHADHDARVVASNRTVTVGRGVGAVLVQAANDTAALAGIRLGQELGAQAVAVIVQAGLDEAPAGQVKDVHQSLSAAGFGAPFARWMRVRSQGMPLASTFAHCAAVRRMERCSSRSSGGVGGRPRPRFCSSMAGSVNELSNHKKALAMRYLLNHNKCTDKRNGANDMQAIKTDDSVTTCDCCGRTGLKFTVLMSNGAHYGSVCATKHAGKSSKELAAEMRVAEEERINAAKTEYRAHPAYAALVAKMAQRPRTLLGRAAADFIRAESDAELAVRRAVAAKFGVQTYQL